MRIAVIGWGSLIWDPRGLSRRGRWRRDGPSLPIEFARKSVDRRLTLVLHPNASEQQTYWILSSLESLDAVREDLSQREGTNERHVHWTSRAQTRNAESSICQKIQAWLADRTDIDAACWTGLPPTQPFDGTNGVADAVAYLEQLRGYTLTNARKYVS